MSHIPTSAPASAYVDVVRDGNVPSATSNGAPFVIGESLTDADHTSIDMPPPNNRHGASNFGDPSAATAAHFQGTVYVQTPIRDPMAASYALAGDHWRALLSMQTMWTFKLMFLLWIALTLCLFVYARGDALAVQLVSSVSVMCVLFYDLRVQSRAAHADRVAMHIACAWVAQSAFTAFSGRTVDQFAMAYISRDFALLFAVMALGVRYWLMNMTNVPSQQSTPFMYAVHRLWSTRSPLAMFCADHSHSDASSNGYYSPMSPHMLGAVDEYGETTRRPSTPEVALRMPYANRPMSSAYVSASQRALALERATAAYSDPAAKGDARRAHGNGVTTQDLLHRVLGGIVALVHEMFYWGYVIGCALPLHNNGLFFESLSITCLRTVLFVTIYMASDAMMDPCTDTAAVHVAPTLFVLSSYMFFVSPWMLFACALHMTVLITYVVVHARAGSLPWSHWACVNNLRREYASRFVASRQLVPQDEVEASMGEGANAASDDEL